MKSLKKAMIKTGSLKTARRTGLQEDWVLAKKERNRVGKLVKDAKAEFVKE